MGDERTADPFDAIAGFNRYVSHMQGIAQRQQARAFAETHGVSVGAAYALLAKCQWSETKAAGMLKGKANA